MPTLTVYVPTGFTVTPIVGDPPDVAALNARIADLTAKVADRDAKIVTLTADRDALSTSRNALFDKIAKAKADLA